LVGVGVSVLGCAGKTADPSGEDTSAPVTASEAADSNESTASEGQASRMDQMVLGGVGSQDPAQAAGNVAAAQWWPAGCATRTRDASKPNQVDIHLQDCSGPFGILHHTGDITVTFSKNADGVLHAEGHSSDMTINGKPVSWSSQADITVNAASKTITIDFKGEWDREDAKGEPLEHQRQGTTVIDVAAKCRDTNGTATTHAAGREIDATIKDYKVCRKADGTDGCPSGEVDHLFKASGKTITVVFDGSAEAKVTGPKGNTVEVPLVCTP
jgi:hypothetical protein